MKNVILIGLIILMAGMFLFGNKQEILAQENKEKIKKEPVVSAVKTIEGEVSGINKDGIAIIYNRNLTEGVEEEIFLPLDNTVKIAHKRDLNEINVGDIVNVQYEEIEEEKDEGLRKTFKGKIVTFVKPAVKKPESSLVPAQEAGSEE